MPLPLLFAVPALLGAAGFGVKKTIDAHYANSEADRRHRRAHAVFDSASEDLTFAREGCATDLARLGRRKLDCWHDDLGRFVQLFQQINAVDLHGAATVDGATGAAFSTQELADMRRISMHASEAVRGGGKALTTGALAGLASYGGATLFASASTGTAIASLSGAAATNATLAWFGGGSLATGGLGIAGGTAVLGGIVAAPVLAVGGMVLAAKAKTNLANARANEAKACQAAAKMRAAESVVRGIQRVAGQFDTLITDLQSRLHTQLDALAQVIDTHGVHYPSYPADARHTVYQSMLFAKTLKAVVEAPLLTKNGALTARHGDVLRAGQDLLQAHP